MGLLGERIQALTSDRNGPKCGVKIALAKLSKTDAEDLVKVLGDEAVPASVISQAVSEAFGIKVAQGTFQRHRRRHCRCHE